jgi:hypothetical protein
MRFVVLVDGRDIIGQRDDDEADADEDEDCIGRGGVRSMHVISDNNKSSKRLATKYGPNARIHIVQPIKPPDISNPSASCPPHLCNLLGKYLVSQKNRIYSNSNTRQLISLQNRLANVEQLATLTIAREIQRNPPKALMAVIGPLALDCNAENVQSGVERMDVGMAVGAWQGPRRRGFGEEGGGAPCPEEFLRKENERG